MDEMALAVNYFYEIKKNNVKKLPMLSKINRQENMVDGSFAIAKIW